MKKNMKKKVWIYSVSILLLLVLGTTLFMWSRKDDEKASDGDGLKIETEDSREEQQGELDEEEDVIILSPDGDFSYDTENSETENTKTEDSKTENSKTENTVTEDTEEKDTNKKEQTDDENPFDLDKDDDGWLDGWH